MSVDLPAEVSALLSVLLAGIQAALGENLVGVYLRGSLVMGDFNPETSDVDFMAVTESAVTPAEFGVLAELHARVAALPNAYARRMEGTYLDREALRRYQPGQRHPTLGQGESLEWVEHHSNWLLERWMVREHGRPLLGPDPRPLIDPIAPDQLRAAVRARLRDWEAWALAPDNVEWLPQRSFQAYAVETMCRALYTLATGELASKPQAGAWAEAALPEPWPGFVAQMRAGRADRTAAPETVTELLRFVRWAAGEGE